MMFSDYHIHTFLCRHAKGKPEEYLSAAEEHGLSEMGFSDHCPWPSGYDEQFRMSADQYSQYRKIVQDLKNSSKKVKVRYGIEIDWAPGKMDELSGNIRNEDFDYIIGSVHHIDGFAFDNPDFASKWKEQDFVDRIWDRYAENLLEFVEAGGFDIIGHPDLPKKFGYFPSSYKGFLEKMDQMLAEAGKKNMALEVNTSGLRKPVGEIYPSPEFLKLARSHRVMITFGSDAHAPSEIAYRFDFASDFVKSCGYTETAFFEKRIPHPVSLG